MHLIFSRSRELLLGAIAGGLMIAASPASAMLYVLDFTTASTTGQIYFIAPDYMTPGALPGAISGIEIVNSYETTVGSDFDNSGIKQRIRSIVPIDGFSNFLGYKNDNELLTFANTNHTIPASSSPPNDLNWFSGGGFAVEAYNSISADATIIDIFVRPVKGALKPTFYVEARDASGNIIYSAGRATLSVPDPTPGLGFFGLAALALSAAGLKLKRRLGAA